MTANPRAVVAGSSLAVTMTLDGPAPAGGMTVVLTTTPPGIVNFYYPFQGIAAGAVSKGTQPSTAAVSSPTTVRIDATAGGITKSTTVVVNPREPVRGVAGDLWADVILGKPDFSEITPNEVTSRALFLPAGVVVDRSSSPNRVYVYDGGNNRVLGMNHLGVCQGLTTQTCTTNSDCGASSPCQIQEGRGADLVLGQPSLDRAACNGDSGFQRNPTRAPASASSLCAVPEVQISVAESVPFSTMFADGGGNLYIADPGNSRVLRYNSPFTTDTIADDVWGQADFSGNSCNRGAASADAQSLCFPTGAALDPAGNLWVSDFSNNRVLRFPRDAGTGSPGHTADIVLGQADFVSKDSGSVLSHMSEPAAVRVDAAGSVYVADKANNRVLVFDPPLITGMTARKLNYAFQSPTGLELDPSGGIWVNDTVNNQLLLFVGGVVQKVLFTDRPDSTGTRHAGCVGDRPDFVFESDGLQITSWDFIQSWGSIGVDSDGNVFASGFSDDVWRFPAPIPTPTPLLAHSADARLFKPYQIWARNETGITGAAQPSGVAVAANQLIVADNARMLFWNDPSSLTDGKPADGFVGTTDPRYQPPWQPFGRIREDGAGHLYANWTNVIRVYDLPLHTGDTPRITIGPILPVLGGGSITFSGESLPIGGVAPVPGKDFVWIADPGANRVLRIRSPLGTPVVDVILGQTSAAGTKCNQGRGQDTPNTPSRTSLCNPGAVRLDPNGNLYVADDGAEVSGNFRMLEFDASLFSDAPTKALFAVPASRVFGTAGNFNLRPCLGDYDQAEPCANLFEPAFTANGQMVVGGNSYLTVHFPYIYSNPLVSQLPTGFLNDWYSWPQSATFDANGDLYVVDGDRFRVLIYRNPLPEAPPGTATLTVTKTGAGTGTVVSTPFGVNCGADCARAFIAGTPVTLVPVPGTNSVFAGWSGDGDCADGILAMAGPKTCTARFDLMPDLIVSALTAPAGALAGSTIVVSDTTKNQAANTSAKSSTTRLYFSTNSAWEAGDTPLGSRAVPDLNGGVSNSGQTSVTIPAGIATGSYYIIAKADADGAVPETLETNNTKAVLIRVSPPDLIVSALSVPTTGGAGASILASNTTKNQTNTGPAALSTTRFYFSTNSILDAQDPEIGSQAIGTLAPGAIEVHTTTLTIPAGKVGTFYVIAKADADGLVGETNETNNTAFDTIVIGPDLLVSALTVPATSGAGLDIVVKDTVKNQGGGAAPASVTSFYLSANTTLGSGDVLLGGRNVDPVDPTKTNAAQTTVTIPSTTAAGTYYILAVADGPGSIAETVETNNTAAAVIRLSPDLVVSALGTPTTAAVGASFNVTDTTKNQGLGTAGPSTTSFYLSVNAIWEIGDRLLNSRSVPQLISGASNPSPVPTSLTIPADTLPGTYYILARADAAGAVSEGNENNNVLGKVITITQP